MHIYMYIYINVCMYVCMYNYNIYITITYTCNIYSAYSASNSLFSVLIVSTQFENTHYHIRNEVNTLKNTVNALPNARVLGSNVVC